MDTGFFKWLARINAIGFALVLIGLLTMLGLGIYNQIGSARERADRRAQAKTAAFSHTINNLYWDLVTVETRTEDGRLTNIMFIDAGVPRATRFSEQDVHAITRVTEVAQKQASVAVTPSPWSSASSGSKAPPQKP